MQCRSCQPTDGRNQPSIDEDLPFANSRPGRRAGFFMPERKDTEMNPTQDTLALVKGALALPDDRIRKPISRATGLVAYDLQAPAKNLYPFVTPLRNSVPRVGGGAGTATNWRQVSALIGSGFDSMGWVPEGQRSGQMSYTTATKSASYVTIGEE